MLELASVGAKVLQTRSVELAMKQRRAGAGAVSSFEPTAPGTHGRATRTRSWNRQLVTGIAYSRDEAKVTLRRVPDRPGVAADDLRRRWPTRNVNVDMIVQNVARRRRRPT